MPFHISQYKNKIKKKIQFDSVKFTRKNNVYIDNLLPSNNAEINEPVPNHSSFEIQSTS